MAMKREADFFEIEEVDQANNLTATYTKSPANTAGERIDVVIPQNSNGYAKGLLSAFLPAGYPHSVTHDYLEYQVYDSLQAFSSSIAGMLSSRAVLEGIGVGDSHASPTAALLLSVLQESMGRISTILFAHRLGTSLEPECKMYRLAADVFNDAAMVLDCLSPAFPKVTRVGLLSLSSVLRSLCGVTAGSSKASLSAHFATQGNLGELNAKDSSQETIISLMGMLAGSLVVSRISSKWATWTAMLFLLTIHLGTNYLAVRAVCMQTLNRQRANIVFSMVLEQLDTQKEKVSPITSNSSNSFAAFDRLRFPKPQDVYVHERVFERDGVLRWKGGEVLGHCKLGVDLQSILNCFSLPHETTGSHKVSHRQKLTKLLQIFWPDEYVIWYDEPRNTFLVVLKTGSKTTSQICAWMFALSFAKSRSRRKDKTLMESLASIAVYVRQIRKFVLQGLVEAGWDLETGALETRSGTRIAIK